MQNNRLFGSDDVLVGVLEERIKGGIIRTVGGEHIYDYPDIGAGCCGLSLGFENFDFTIYAVVMTFGG